MFPNVFDHFLPYQDDIWGPFFCRLSWFRHRSLLLWAQESCNNPYPFWVSKYREFLEWSQISTVWMFLEAWIILVNIRFLIYLLWLSLCCTIHLLFLHVPNLEFHNLWFLIVSEVYIYCIIYLKKYAIIVFVSFVKYGKIAQDWKLSSQTLSRIEKKILSELLNKTQNFTR